MKGINSIHVKMFWLFVALASVSRLGCSHSAAQVKKKTAERRQLLLPTVTCSARRVRAVFGSMVDEEIHVRDESGAAVPVSQSADSCGVKVVREKNRNLTFLSRLDSCYAQIDHNRVVIPLQVQLRGEDQRFRVNISCPLRKRSSDEASVGPKLLSAKCGTVKALRVACGHQRISSQACNKRGCCYDAHDSTCYHKLNACSRDGNFVFSVEVADTHQPFNPSNLTVKGHPECRPVVSTVDAAVFKIGVTECGAKMKKDGDVFIYELEVEERHSESKAKYPAFSLLVQCTYATSDLQRAAELRSLYAVTNPPPVVAQGVLKLQMRIAKDASFASFFPENDLPLTLPLREAAYVEVSIAQPSPDPTLSLQVQDCFAHPVSRHSVWLLLYDGCPNPMDNMKGSVPVDKQGKTTSHSQVRRFNVKTFAFLDPHTGRPSEEEMYFYCWVEICTDDDDCAQRCTIVSADGKRRRRETTTKSAQFQLVSYGPLLLRQSSAEGESSPYAKQTAMLRVTVYAVSGVAAALLLILLFILISNVTKWTKKKLMQEPLQNNGNK